MKTISISNLPLDKSSVFVIIDQSLSGKAGSDVLYIGRSKKPSKRILGGYLSGYGGKSTQKISQKLFSEGYLERTAISILLTEKPRIMQQTMLAKFAEEQGAYPIWNNKKKIFQKMKTKLADKSKTTGKVKKVEKAKATAKPKAVAKTKSVEKGKAVVNKGKVAAKQTVENDVREKINSNTEGTTTSSISP